MEFEYPVETDDGFVLYPDDEPCPYCGEGEVQPQRMQSDHKSVRGETVFMRGCKCDECGKNVNVLDEEMSDSL